MIRSGIFRLEFPNKSPTLQPLSPQINQWSKGSSSSLEASFAGLLSLIIYRQAEKVWNYLASGYQVLDKYLYDRREKKLTNEEIQHYCKVVTALYHTIELQQEIDEVFAGVEEDVVKWDAGG